MHTDLPPKLHGVKHIIAAFGYSMSGLRIASKESAIRHELIIAAIHFSALIIFGVPFSLGLILTLALGVVLIVEVLNTAIETTVDLVSPNRNQLAKKAKDLGSAAVFCALVLFYGGWLFSVMEVVK